MRASNAALKEDVREHTILDELNKIKDGNGGLLDPVQVVEYARDKSTLLHNKFTWDNTKAASEYRIWQARQIIRLELVVVRQEPGGHVTLTSEKQESGSKDKTIRAFVSLQLDRFDKGARGYRSIESVMQRDDLRFQLLEEAKKDMGVFRRKYGILERLAGVFKAMDEI